MVVLITDAPHGLGEVGDGFDRLIFHLLMPGSAEYNMGNYLSEHYTGYHFSGPCPILPSEAPPAPSKTSFSPVPSIVPGPVTSAQVCSLNLQ